MRDESPVDTIPPKIIALKKKKKKRFQKEKQGLEHFYHKYQLKPFLE